MKHKLLVLSAMVLGSIASQSVMAQAAAVSASAPATRAEVKADLQRDHVNGEVRKVDLEKSPPISKSVKPRPSGDNQPAVRSDVRTEGNRARANKEVPQGETPIPASEKANPSVSTKSRAEVKAEVPTPVERAKDNGVNPKVDPKGLK